MVDDWFVNGYISLYTPHVANWHTWYLGIWYLRYVRILQRCQCRVIDPQGSMCNQGCTWYGCTGGFVLTKSDAKWVSFVRSSQTWFLRTTFRACVIDISALHRVRLLPFFFTFLRGSMRTFRSMYPYSLFSAVLTTEHLVYTFHFSPHFTRRNVSTARTLIS